MCVQGVSDRIVLCLWFSLRCITSLSQFVKDTKINKVSNFGMQTIRPHFGGATLLCTPVYTVPAKLPYPDKTRYIPPRFHTSLHSPSSLAHFSLVQVFRVTHSNYFLQRSTFRKQHSLLPIVSHREKYKTILLSKLFGSQSNVLNHFDHRMSVLIVSQFDNWRHIPHLWNLFKLVEILRISTSDLPLLIWH